MLLVNQLCGFGAQNFRPETYALVAQMSVQPSFERMRLIDNLIGGLKDDGLWTKLGLLGVFAAHDEQAARLNWIDPTAGNFTAVNSPTFTTDEGFTGDGTTSYLNSAYAWNAIPNFGLDDCHLGGWIIGGTGSTTATDQLLGSQAVGGSTRILVRISSSNLQVAVNSSLSVLGSISSVLGHWNAVRRGSTEVEGYLNGTSNGTDNETSASVPSAALSVLAHGGNRSNFQVCCVHAGAALSDTEASNLHSRLNTYMTAVGAV